VCTCAFLSLLPLSASHSSFIAKFQEIVFPAASTWIDQPKVATNFALGDSTPRLNPVAAQDNQPGVAVDVTGVNTPRSKSFKSLRVSLASRPRAATHAL